MSKFNLRQQKQVPLFLCKRCGLQANYTTASQGCPSCGFYLFKVADKGYPQMLRWDYPRNPDGSYNPYKTKDPSRGDGYERSRAGSIGFPGEPGSFPSAFGPPDRDGAKEDSMHGLNPDPAGRDKVPGDHDDYISNPPTPTDLKPWDVSEIFMPPGSPIGIDSRVTRELDGRGQLDSGGMDQQLARSRMLYDRDDRRRSVFKQIAPRLRGVNR